jgi:S1-C subfamily serine protease
MSQLPPPRGRPSRAPIVTVLAVALAVTTAVVWLGRRSELPPPPAVPEPRAVAPRGDLAAAEHQTIELFEDVSRSVVHITTIELQRGFFRFDVTAIPGGTGTGFVWDRHGHVVTNYHVVHGAEGARVTLSDGTTVDAQFVGAAPDQDLAVLRVGLPPDRLHPIRVGTSADLRVGQSVFAIGNPFGLDQTLTTGVISGLGREIESMTRRKIRDVIQTDAAINPGNSGGPLIDSARRLIGVNTAIYSPSGAYAGIGFAVPVDAVNRIVPQLIANGRVVRPGLGVHVAVDAMLARMGLDGVLVLEGVAGSAAEQAGLRGTTRARDGRVVLGDRIVEAAGEPVRDRDDLNAVLDRHAVGDLIAITVDRNGVRRTVDVTLQALQ